MQPTLTGPVMGVMRDRRKKEHTKNLSEYRAAILKIAQEDEPSAKAIDGLLELAKKIGVGPDVADGHIAAVRRRDEILATLGNLDAAKKKMAQTQKRMRECADEIRGLRPKEISLRDEQVQCEFEHNRLGLLFAELTQLESDAFFKGGSDDDNEGG